MRFINSITWGTVRGLRGPEVGEKGSVGDSGTEGSRPMCGGVPRDGLSITRCACEGEGEPRGAVAGCGVGTSDVAEEERGRSTRRFASTDKSRFSGDAEGDWENV